MTMIPCTQDAVFVKIFSMAPGRDVPQLEMSYKAPEERLTAG